MGPDNIKTVIREAFQNVQKGDIGVREAAAIDDYASAVERCSARKEDVEVNWWDIPSQWRPRLGDALSFTDVHGFRFLLPAAMIGSLDKVENDPGHSVWFHLALLNKKKDEQRPHHGHPAYIKYLEGISPRDNADHFSIDTHQIHAVARFLDWYTRDTESLLCLPREQYFEVALQSNQLYRSKVPITHYSLTVDDEMAVFDQECRILRDWLNIGGVQPLA